MQEMTPEWAAEHILGGWREVVGASDVLHRASTTEGDLWDLLFAPLWRKACELPRSWKFELHDDVLIVHAWEGDDRENDWFVVSRYYNQIDHPAKALAIAIAEAEGTEVSDG